MCNFFLSVSFIVSVKVRIFPLNMRDIIIYVARWWEKCLSKCNLLKHTCSWRVNKIFLIIIKPSFSFYNMFCDIEYPVAFHLLRDSSNICNHIVVFFSFSSLERFWYLSRAFFVGFLYFLNNICLIHFHKKMDLLKDFNFFMIHIIHKMLAVLKNHVNFLKLCTHWGFKWALQ